MLATQVKLQHEALLLVPVVHHLQVVSGVQSGQNGVSGLEVDLVESLISLKCSDPLRLLLILLSVHRHLVLLHRRAVFEKPRELHFLRGLIWVCNELSVFKELARGVGCRMLDYAFGGS